MQRVIEAVSDNKPLVIALTVIMLLVQGGFTGLRMASPQNADVIRSTKAIEQNLTALTQMVKSHDDELNKIGLWMASTDANRYTATDARYHADEQGKEFSKVYAEMNQIKRDILIEQRRTGELTVKLTEQIANQGRSIDEIKKIVSHLANRE